MNCTILLIVRTNSKRLSKKIFLKIKQKPLIKILIDRLNNSLKTSDIIVCTTKNKTDDDLVKYLEMYKIKIFRGSEKDIIKRIKDCAEKFHLKKFVIVEGDDLFCDHELIIKTCDIINKNNVDFVAWNNVPFGSSPVALSYEALKKLVIQKSISITETGWIKFIFDSGIFKTKTLIPKNKKLHRPDIRLSIDYREDFILAKKLYQILPDEFNLGDIVDIFENNISLLKINESVKIKYAKNFEKKMIRSKK